MVGPAGREDNVYGGNGFVGLSPVQQAPCKVTRGQVCIFDRKRFIGIKCCFDTYDTRWYLKCHACVPAVVFPAFLFFRG